MTKRESITLLRGLRRAKIPCSRFHIPREAYHEDINYNERLEYGLAIYKSKKLPSLQFVNQDLYQHLKLYSGAWHVAVSCITFNGTPAEYLDLTKDKEFGIIKRIF